MLKVMGQTRRLVRIVLRANPDRNISLQARGFFIDGHVDFQPVVERINLRLQRIALHCLIFVFRARAKHEQCKDRRKTQ